MLGTWLFAVFVGLANACVPQPFEASQNVGMAMGSAPDGDDDLSANCLQFCSIDTPPLSKLQLIQDQPAGQSLLVASVGNLLLPAPAPAVIVLHLAHPPADVPILLRSLRLAL